MMVYILTQLLSQVWLFVTPWTLLAPLSMGFPKQDYWNGLPFPIPGNHPNPGIESMSLASPALAGRFFTTCATWEACFWRQLAIKSKSMNISLKIWKAIDLWFSKLIEWIKLVFLLPKSTRVNNQGPWLSEIMYTFWGSNLQKVDPLLW